MSKQHRFFVHLDYIKKLRRNRVKFVNIWPSTYRCNVDIKSVLHQVGVQLKYCFYWTVTFLRNHFGVSIEFKLSSNDFIRSTCNVAAVLQNSKHFLCCT